MHLLYPKRNRGNPDIWGDVFKFTGRPYEFSLTLQDPDYGIPTKNIWILGFPRFALDWPPSTMFRGLRNPSPAT
jgi:hypothetical protein